MSDASIIRELWRNPKRGLAKKRKFERENSETEVFLEAINKYYWERLERNNVVLELNCAFQKTDIFEPFSLEYKLSESREGEVELMT